MDAYAHKRCTNTIAELVLCPCVCVCVCIQVLAFFTMGTACAALGVATDPVPRRAFLASSLVPSLAYAALAFVAGALVGVTAYCNMSIAKSLRPRRRAGRGVDVVFYM